MTDYARRERSELADLLLAAGPDAPTLCTGWTARDLAAHLVVRERRPDATIGNLVPRLRAHGEQVRQATASRPYDDVVREVRTPPWWSPLSNPLTDELFNGGEFFIHHEDLRRGGPDWEPRTLSERQQRSLWTMVKFTGRIGLRRLGIPVLIEAPGFGTLAVGGEPPQVTVTGDPGELALFLSGRQRAARVDVQGDAADRLRTAKLGM